MGHPQNSTKKHFLTTLRTVIPETGKDGRFQEWFGIASDKARWEQTLDTYLARIYSPDDIDVVTDSSEYYEPDDREPNDPQ